MKLEGYKKKMKLPPQTRLRASFDWKKLPVGASFLVASRSIANSRRQLAKKQEVRLTMREVDGKIRLWRLS